MQTPAESHDNDNIDNDDDNKEDDNNDKDDWVCASAIEAASLLAVNGGGWHNADIKAFPNYDIWDWVNSASEA